MSDRSALTIGIVLGALLLLCLCCTAVIAGGVYFFGQWYQDAGTFYEYEDLEYISEPTPTAQILEEWQVSEEDVPLAEQALLTLDAAIVPENDPADLAVRLSGVSEVPETYLDPNAPHQVGEVMTFWATDTDTNLSAERTAVLRYVTDHAYFWIEESVSYNERELERLAESFENEIYPTTREFFGSEWTPGIDGDEHIYILYVRGIGFSVAGYFSSADSVHPLAHEYSNAHEMFVFNADNTPLGESYTYSVLAHEFQHMIHWNQDRNESSWINEGFSEVATLLNGLGRGGFDMVYANDPDLQLNDWPNNGETTPHYGAAFLFMTYFLDRMGAEASQTLVRHPENGMKSIDLLLHELGSTDPLTGQPITADDLVLDWALTNYLQDKNISDGRFNYYIYDNPPGFYDTEEVTDCGSGLQPRTVHQYGVDYIRFNCGQPRTLRFEGSLKTTLLPESAYSGDFSFWSNKGDESDMTLTRQFDLTGVTGEVTFSYWTWHDIETDWDYVYLLASTDGEKWEIIRTPSSTDADPTGNSFGWGYTGPSGSLDPIWIREEVDLSRFAGQNLWLRFEYVTDAAVNGEGFLVDDLAIPQIDYFTDLETDDGGWQAEGFVRVPNLLPQTFRLALIHGQGRNSTIEYLKLDEENSVEIPLDEEAVLVVLGTTRYTRQLASYQFEFLP